MSATPVSRVGRRTRTAGPGPRTPSTGGRRWATGVGPVFRRSGVEAGGTTEVENPAVGAPAIRVVEPQSSRLGPSVLPSLSSPLRYS